VASCTATRWRDGRVATRNDPLEKG
jgi:hypothetical protein